MLISAWENMKEDHPETKDRLTKALEENGRAAFMAELRFVVTILCLKYCSLITVKPPLTVPLGGRKNAR